MTRTITIKGTGEVSSKPDLIIINLELSAKRAKYDETMEAAAEQLESLREAIIGVSMKREDLKTVNFNVQTVYESVKDKEGNYKRVFNGYECQHSLRLEFDFDMKQLSKTLGALSKSSAVPEFKIRFAIKDEEALKNEVLRSASENARLKAMTLCEAAGVMLGQLVRIDYSWSDLNIYSNSDYMMESSILTSAKMAPSIEIEPEDVFSSDTVTFIWEIE